jgi:adenosylhomocysteinase
VAVEGLPASVMNMSFANQSFSVLCLVKNCENLENNVYAVLEKLDNEIASFKLNSIGIKINAIVKEQKECLNL